MTMNNKSMLCPVCGFNLGFEPWKGESASDEYCPCCGIQFGYHDVTEASGMEGTKEQIYMKWRKHWIENAMKWDSDTILPPLNWNPCEQLKTIGIDE